MVEALQEDLLDALVGVVAELQGTATRGIAPLVGEWLEVGDDRLHHTQLRQAGLAGPTYVVGSLDAYRSAKPARDQAIIGTTGDPYPTLNAASMTSRVRAHGPINLA